MTDATSNRVPIALFRAFDAPEHGWFIDENHIATKGYLTITDHGLYNLVMKEGWREAERLISEYGRFLLARGE